MASGYVPFHFYELRPTNNVQLYDRIVEVIGTSITETSYIVETKPLYSEELNEPTSINLIKPIPLTPLMIKQLGVQMLTESRMYEHDGFRIYGGSKNCYSLINHSIDKKYDNFIKEISYVHELQNFFLEMKRTILRIPFSFYQYHQNHLEELV